MQLGCPEIIIDRYVRLKFIDVIIKNHQGLDHTMRGATCAFTNSPRAYIKRAHSAILLSFRA